MALTDSLGPATHDRIRYPFLRDEKDMTSEVVTTDRRFNRAMDHQPLQSWRPGHHLTAHIGRISATQPVGGAA